MGAASGKGQSILVIAPSPEAADELELFGGPKHLPAERLGEMLQDFTAAFGRAVDRVQSVSASFDLTEVTVRAQLMGEAGLALIVGSKIGAEAAIELKFTRKTPA